MTSSSSTCADPEEPDTEVDVLAWWKAKEPKWPALAKMVKQYFAAPASSAGVERVFSAAGKMHGDLQKSAKDSTWKADGHIKHESDKTMTFKSKQQWHGESTSAGLSLKASQSMDAQAAMISEKASGFFIMKGSIIKLN